MTVEGLVDHLQADVGKVEQVFQEAADDGKLLKVSYTARFMANGKKFDNSDNYVFRVGAQEVLPGLDQGVKVRACVRFFVRFVRSFDCIAMSFVSMTIHPPE